jgi:hypothetical protein
MARGGLMRVAEDVAGVVARLGAELRRAGVPAGPDRCERFARAITVARPRTMAALRECALATLVTSREQAAVLGGVFDELFGSGEAARSGGNGAYRADGSPGSALSPPNSKINGDFQVLDEHQSSVDLGSGGKDGGSTLARAARAAREHALADISDGGDAVPELGGGASEAAGADAQADKGDEDAPPVVRVRASESERLTATDFAMLSPGELALLAGVMRRLTLAVPERRSRRESRGPRGRHADLRATLRRARRTGGHPFGIIKKSPATRPRKLVVLCDISGSMEPYSRAMLQLLYCAAGGARAEVFSFATRLTRLTRALAEPEPELALQRAGQAAPDWHGGTRIGASLKEFNDSWGQRGVARGAVVVVVSDGWDTGDPAEVRREMERLSRVAFRIVWVNPRTQNAEYRPLAGGMAAAWPYCDAVVSAHRIDALDELTAALADPVRRRHPGPAPAAPG